VLEIPSKQKGCKFREFLRMSCGSLYREFHLLVQFSCQSTKIKPQREDTEVETDDFKDHLRR
jgi:hypothetical protein